MSHEPSDKLDPIIKRLLAGFVAPLNPKLEDRTIDLFWAAREARLHRRRLLAWTLGAATCLAGLGFVPLPLGTAKGAWARAVSAAREIVAAHIQVRDKDGQLETEEWVGKDGFVRDVGYQNGQLTHVSLRGANTVDYDVKNRSAKEYDTPQNAQARDLLVSLRKALVDLQAYPDLQVIERRAGSLWSGIYDIVEVSGIIKGQTLNLLGTEYEDGDRIMLRMRLAPDTGRIFFIEQRRFDAIGIEQDADQVSFNWDVEAPPELRAIAYPDGTTVQRGNSQCERPAQLITTASTPHWEVILRAIDVDLSGDLQITLSRRVILDDTERGTRPVMPLVVGPSLDDVGGTYAQDQTDNSGSISGVYKLIRHAPANATSLPKRITLKIYPNPSQARDNEYVIFKDILLPARSQAEVEHGVK